MIYNFPSGKIVVTNGRKLTGLFKENYRPFSCELSREDVQYLIENPDYLETIKQCLSYRPTQAS